MGKKKEYASMEDVPSDDNFEFDDLKDDSNSFSETEEYAEFSVEVASGELNDYDDDGKPNSEAVRQESSSSVTGETSLRSTRSGAMERRRSRRSVRNQSPSTITNARTRRCDRGRQDRTRKSTSGPITPTSLHGRRSISNSPHQMRRTRAIPARRRNSGGVLLRSNQPRRSQSADPDDAAEAPLSPSDDLGEEKSSRHNRRSVMRKRNKSPGSLMNLNTSVSRLYSGGEGADSLHTPDLNDGYASGEDGAEEGGEISDDGAELVRDELADIEGLVEAAKGVSVSS